MVRNISKSPLVRAFGIRYTLIIIGVLLGINTGIAGFLGQQIGTSAAVNTQVKNESVGADEAIPAETQSAPENDAISLPVAEDKATITTYIVKEGDTLGAIAEKHHISTNTIRWANNLGAKSTIKIGQELTILPVSGVQYTVKKGDTLSGIASKFHADTEEILNSNELMDADSLKVGMTLIIPDAEPIPVAPPKKTAVSKPSSVNTKESSDKEETKPSSTKSSTDLVTPIGGAILTQGKHGTNAVDFGAPVGTNVFAAASGKVILAKGNGAYNGGYGNYIVIEHGNGTQTLYAHLSKVSVSVGESVSQGEIIGKSGNTGRSTGPHLHFEVRGGTNPFTSDKKGTHY